MLAKPFIQKFSYKNGTRKIKYLFAGTSYLWCLQPIIKL